MVGWQRSAARNVCEVVFILHKHDVLSSVLQTQRNNSDVPTLDPGRGGSFYANAPPLSPWSF